VIGCIRHIRARGRNKPVLSYIDNLVLLETQLYEPEGLSARKVEKRLNRLENILCRQGIGRVILPERFPYKSRLKQLRPVEVLPFYREVGDVFALEWLSSRRILPTEARVVLAAPRLCSELQSVAERLCPRVREMVILVPDGGEDYAGVLHSRYGLPVTPCLTEADVTVAFGPVAGLSGKIVRLYENGAETAGLRLSVPGLDLPEEYSQAILALLWEYGRLKREELRATFCHQAIANESMVCYNN